VFERLIKRGEERERIKNRSLEEKYP